MWRIRNDSLWLVRVDGRVAWEDSRDGGFRESGASPQTRSITRQYLFPKSTGPVLADWFTGELGIPEGAFVARESDFRSIFDREIRLTIVRGLIMGSQTMETVAEYRVKVAKRMADLKRVLPVTPDDKGWVTCPHCGKRFWAYGKNLVDGVAHRYCGGRVDIGD